MKQFLARAVLFDLDGVLVDSTVSVERAWHLWAQRHALDVTAVLALAHGRRSVETIRLVAPHLSAEREAQVLDLSQAMDTSADRAVKGAAELLASLPAEHWAVVTSGPLVLATARLHAVGLPLPRVLVTADDVSMGKPHPEGYLKAAHLLRVAPEECIVLEDAPTGIAAGLAAGMMVIAVATTYSPTELTTATRTVQTLADVQVKVSQDAPHGIQGSDLVLSIT